MKVRLIIIIFMVIFMGCITPQQQRRTNYLNTHPELKDSIRTLIAAKKIVPGMTMEQVKASWGRPRKTITSSYGKDSWIYKWDMGGFCRGCTAQDHLYFIDGKLNSWIKYK